MRDAGLDIVSFTLGEPDFPSPQCAIAAAEYALEHNFTKYTAFDGIPELRAAVAEKFNRDNGLRATPESVIISCGGKHSIFNILMAVCEEGDEVLIPAPYWVSYPEMVKLTAATPVILSTTSATRFKITADQLRAAITPRTKMLIINTPSNPTGMMYTADELHEIAKVLAGTGIYILSDELYEKIVFDGNRHVSIGSFDEVRDQTITVNGASKIFAMTGWRIGFLTGPMEVVHAASIVQSQSTTNATSFAQKGVLAALKDSGADVVRMVEAYHERRDVIVDLLENIPGISFCRPDGTFYVWVNVSNCFTESIPDVQHLAFHLLQQHHVGVMPGSAFGDPNHIRISFSCSLADIRKGVLRLASGLHVPLPAAVV